MIDIENPYRAPNAPPTRPTPRKRFIKWRLSVLTGLVMSALIVVPIAADTWNWVATRHGLLVVPLNWDDSFDKLMPWTLAACFTYLAVMWRERIRGRRTKDQPLT